LHENSENPSGGPAPGGRSGYGKSLDPDNPRAFRCQADYLRALGQLDKALQSVERAIRLDSQPEDLARDYLLKGVIIASSGNLPAAMDALKKAASLDPADPLVFFDLAIVYHAQAFEDESDRAYAEAIRLTTKSRSIAVPVSQIQPPSKRGKPTTDHPERHLLAPPPPPP